MNDITMTDFVLRMVVCSLAGLVIGMVLGVVVAEIGWWIETRFSQVEGEQE